MSTSSSKSYYIITLALSVIGAILFATTDFGGYLGYYAYSVSLETSFYNPGLMIYSPLFIIATLLFLLNVYISLKELGYIKSNFPKNSVKLGLYSSLGILAITVMGGLSFELLLSRSGARDWWFDSGFYAGIIGGILLPILYNLISKNVKN